MTEEPLPVLTALEPPPALPAEPTLVEPIQPETPAPAPTPREPGLESKVGLTLVNRIGAITLVLGVAFFFKWAVDNNWIGPAGRVILGLLAGFATLSAADFIWRKRQQVFAQGITATGIAIIYLSLYAAFNFYNLIPQSAAFITMVATTAMAAVLALRYKSFAIAALGLAAAYVTPLLLSTGEDHPWFLFSYLLLLNFAATELAKRGLWPRLEIISFVATDSDLRRLAAGTRRPSRKPLRGHTRTARLYCATLVHTNAVAFLLLATIYRLSRCPLYGRLNDRPFSHWRCW